jgi:PAS domain S-box-containing protein
MHVHPEANPGSRINRHLIDHSIHFYAGVPLVAEETVVGVLSVASFDDATDVRMDDPGLARLSDAADAVVDLLRSQAAPRTEAGSDVMAEQSDEDLLARIFDTSAAAITVLDADGQIVRANHRAEEVLGLGPDRIAGRSYDDPDWRHTTLDGDPLPEDEQPFVQVKQRNAPVYDLRHAIEGPDGRRRVLSINGAPLRDENERFAGAVFVVTDITQKERRQQALKRRQMLLKESQRIAQLGHWEWEVGTGTIHWSDETYRIFGYEPQSVSVTLETYLNALPEEDRQRVRLLTRRALETGYMPTITHSVLQPDGTERIVELSGTAIEETRDGRPKRVIGTVLDITDRRRREEDLRRSKLALEQAQEITNTGNGIWDLEDNTFTLSDQGARILGLNPNETYTMLSFFRLIHPEDRAKIQDRFRSLARGEAFDEEYRIRPADREETRWVRGRGYAVTKEGGEPTHVFGTIADITEEKRRATIEQRFGRLLDSLVSEIYVFDAETLRFVQVNEGGVENLGYRPDALSEMTPTDIMPCGRAEFEAHLQPLREGETNVVSFDTTYRREDGSTYPVRVRIQLSKSETPPVFIAVVHDVTEEKRRENRLQALYDASSALNRAETAEELARVVERLVTKTLDYPICAVRYEKDGRLTPIAVSVQCREHMGTPRPDYDVDGLSNAAHAFRKGRAIFLSPEERPRGIEAPGAVRAGAYVPIGSHGVISIGALTADSIDRFDVQLVDILAQNAASVLQRIQQENDLRKARDEAEKMNRLKTALLTNMSHEIRTPLTSIIGFTEMLVEESFGDPADRFIDLVYQNGQRLLQTLNSVLDLSQIEAGTVSLHAETVDVATEIREIASSFAAEAEADGIDMTVTTVPDTLPASVDRGALQRVATNLIGNAVKFTRAGGRVSVRLRAEDEDFVLQVEDTGVGIGEEFAQKMFDAFQQESSGTDREFEGSGLGLTITQRLVEAMGGDIAVDSVKGEGTTMTVRLPLQ